MRVIFCYTQLTNERTGLDRSRMAKSHPCVKLLAWICVRIIMRPGPSPSYYSPLGPPKPTKTASPTCGTMSGCQDEHKGS